MTIPQSAPTSPTSNLLDPVILLFLLFLLFLSRLWAPPPSVKGILTNRLDILSKILSSEDHTSTTDSGIPTKRFRSSVTILFVIQAPIRVRIQIRYPVRIRMRFRVRIRIRFLVNCRRMNLRI